VGEAVSDAQIGVPKLRDQHRGIAALTPTDHATLEALRRHDTQAAAARELRISRHALASRVLRLRDKGVRV
jgi:hypothetical protein